MNKKILKLLMFVFFSHVVLFANTFPLIDEEYANEFSKLLVQSKDGRIKPLDTLHMDLLNKLTHKSRLGDLSYNQVILGMTYFPQVWRGVELFEIKHPKLFKRLNLKNSKTSYAQFYNVNGIYILEEEVEQVIKIKESERNSYQKELIKLDEKIKIVNRIYDKGFMKIYSLKNSLNNTWYSPLTLKKNFNNETKYEAQLLYVRNKKDVENALYTKNWTHAIKNIDNIQTFQKNYAGDLYLSPTAVDVEVFYNKILIFEKLYPLYLFLGLILFVLVFISILTSKEYKKVQNLLKYVILITFFVHILGLILRWYISGYAPWTGAYESMVFISLCVIFSGLVFAKRSLFALASSSFLAGILLFVAHLYWVDPQIYTLGVNFQSIWLLIHVTVISASYGFLAISALLGIITLILLSIEKKSKNEIATNINESFKTNEISMIIGLSLLTIGTLLGSVFANEVWGRIWGWDPKETWSLISVLIYMICLHIRFIPQIYSVYIFSVLSVVCYSTIIMTYFGVNYFFDAMHVFASKSGSDIPTYTYYILGAIVLLIGLSFKNRNYKC